MTDAEKIREKIHKAKKMMREKRGIIKALLAPPEKHKSLLVQTRADMRELEIKLKELKEQYNVEVAKNRNRKRNVFIGEYDFDDSDY